MILKQSFGLIVTVVDKDFSDVVIEVAKANGAEGATIINARGTGIHESSSFMGINIQPEKEIVLMVVKKQIRKKVMRAILKDANISEEGHGLTFALPLGEIAGISHLFQQQKLDEKKEKQAEQAKQEKLDSEKKTESENKTENIEKKQTEKQNKNNVSEEKTDKKSKTE